MSNSSCTNCPDSSITAECTVDAVIAMTPTAVSVLNEFNIDTCGGGRATIGDAAVHAHVDATVLMNALGAAQRGEASMQAASPPAASCSCGCR